MPAKPEEIGAGPTEELCLRVSAATLVRVSFPHPETGQRTLVLERVATRIQAGGTETIAVTAKPFGGSVRINRPAELFARIGNFRFDSPRSRDEQDFRILIRPVDWETVKHWSLGEFRAGRPLALETSPARELAEEFMDTLQVSLSPTQYRLEPLELLVENEPAPTDNQRAARLPTARILITFEAQLVDPVLIQRLLDNHVHLSDQALVERAREDAQRGGKGRANGVLAVPLEPLRELYLDLPAGQRDHPVTAEGRRLEGNVAAVLGGIVVPKYERFSL